MTVMKDNPGGIRWQDGSPAYNDSFHTIDVTPTWDACTRIYLEVLRVNEWGSEPCKTARQELQRMAQGFDRAQKWINENHDAIEQALIVKENK